MSPLSPLPQKYRGDFLLKKVLHGGTNFFWENLWGLFYMKSNDQIIHGRRKSFTNAFSSYLNTVNLKFFAAMVGDALEN